MLDYKDIIIKHNGLNMSGREIAKQLGVSKSGVNGVLSAFKDCKTLGFPLPDGITNYAIADHIYGPQQPPRGEIEFAVPDFEDVYIFICSLVLCKTISRSIFRPLYISAHCFITRLSFLIVSTFLIFHVDYWQQVVVYLLRTKLHVLYSNYTRTYFRLSTELL